MNIVATSLLSGYLGLQCKLLWVKSKTKPIQDERAEKVIRLAKEMGYNYPLEVRVWKKPEDGSASAVGSRFSLIRSTVILNPKKGAFGEEFTYAHEMAHVTKEHFLQGVTFLTGAFNLSRFIFTSLPPAWGYLSIALVAPVAYRVFLSLQRAHEKEADLIGCQHVSQQEIGSILHRFNSPLWIGESEWTRMHPKMPERVEYLKEEFYKKGKQPPSTFNNQTLSLETSDTIRGKIKQSTREVTLIDASNIELGKDQLKIITMSKTDSTLSLSKGAIAAYRSSSDDRGLINLVEEGLKSPRYLSLFLESKGEEVNIETLRKELRSMPHAEKYDFNNMLLITGNEKNKFEVRIPYLSLTS